MLLFFNLIIFIAFFREIIEEYAPDAGFEMPGFAESMTLRSKNLAMSMKLIWNAILHLVFGVPVPRRVKVA
jgi:hypothetical protein